MNDCHSFHRCGQFPIAKSCEVFEFWRSKPVDEECVGRVHLRHGDSEKNTRQPASCGTKGFERRPLDVIAQVLVSKPPIVLKQRPSDLLSWTLKLGVTVRIEQDE